MLKRTLNASVLAALIALAAPAARAELPERVFVLASPGSPGPVDYESYGAFSGVGTNGYAYRVLDEAGLARAAGEGVYPNRSHADDPQFRYFVSAQGEHFNIWDFRSSRFPQNDFYAWCLAGDQDEGTKLFHIGEALRRAGLLNEALKAYHALVVHFPRTVIWSADGAWYWYPAPEAIARLRKICAEHPELGLRYEEGFVEIERSPENKPGKDSVKVWPGRFLAGTPEALDPAAPETARRGDGRVRAVQYGGRDWRLFVDGKPFFIRGITYTATTVGESAHAINLRPWMTVDDDKNGRNDGMFDSWVDTDRDNRRDPDEPAVGDAELLRRMGANTIRHYHHMDEKGDYNPKEYDKPLMRRLNREYGLYFIMGDFLGAYTIGSNANWDAGTDYTDPEQKERMLRMVTAMVEDHKDEPYVLFWLLGNENQHPHTHTNAHEHPEAYARFLNEVARRIHEIDPDHPVAVCNLNFQGLAEIARYAPEVDLYGANVYSGEYSMGSVWHLVRRHLDRPVFITEMGCDVYAEGKGTDEKGQARYFTSNWADITGNAAGARGEGNSLGGVFFEWMDEWWKTSKGDSWGDPQTHNTEGDFQGPFPDGWMHEEWLGIFGQGDGRSSPFLREPRAVYEEIRGSWLEAE